MLMRHVAPIVVVLVARRMRVGHVARRAFNGYPKDFGGRTSGNAAIAIAHAFAAVAVLDFKRNASLIGTCERRADASHSSEKREPKNPKKANRGSHMSAGIE